MKKQLLTCALALGICAGTTFAELYPATRWFEFGVDTRLQLNQNAVTVEDIFQKTISVDLTKIADEMGSDGLVFNSGVEPLIYADLRLGPIGAGIALDFDNSVKFGIGKGFFEFLGYGNEDGNIETSFNVGMQSFIKASTPVRFKMGRLRFKVEPTAFIPVVYVPYNTSKISGKVTETDGTYKIDADGGFDVYTLFPIGALTGESMDFNQLLSDITSGNIAQELLSSFGLGINAEVEFPLFRTLDVGVFTELPFVAGHLKYVTDGYVSYSQELSVKGMMDGTTTFSTPEYGFNGCSTLATPYEVRTPFRIGVEGAWRPFGKWCTFRPRFGYAVNNPFGEDTKGWENFKASAYPEYALGTDITLIYIFNFWFNHQYVEQVFSNRFGFGLNLRMFELDISLASSSASFEKSWSLGGVDAQIGIKMGL